MQQTITLRLSPADAADESLIKKHISGTTGKKLSSISGFQILKRSMDARSNQVRINLSLLVFLDEPFVQRKLTLFNYPQLKPGAPEAVIIGAGPAGLFAALHLIGRGIRPVILERGKDVRSRRRDLARLNKEGIVDPESNYCFGEGGAGTYSDGKLYTRSNKRGNIDHILNRFVEFGASEEILFEAHPHIGTNKLPGIITAMRQKIEDCGGLFYFEKKMDDLVIEHDRIKSIRTTSDETITADAFILATGHSARDVFELLHAKKIRLEPKPFALGVRIEHPQSLIDSIQYHCAVTDMGSIPGRGPILPPAAYNLVQQVNGRGVFSFCMCPGGIIAPAATAPGEIVVNGWSPSKRNNPFANSGMVVQVELEDAWNELKKEANNDPRFPKPDVDDPLLFMRFQQLVEQKCFSAGGGKQVAPAQRMTDFCNGTGSSSLPECSYLPGTRSVNMGDILPAFIYKSLAGGFAAFGKKMHGYLTREAIVVATESRTSSPVRIPRDAGTLTHPQLKNLYPCGEGAGYAGGIVSAAMDGERVAESVAVVLKG